VRDAPRQPADALHFHGMAQLFLESRSFFLGRLRGGDIADEEQCHGPPVVYRPGSRDGGPERVAVQPYVASFYWRQRQPRYRITYTQLDFGTQFGSNTLNQRVPYQIRRCGRAEKSNRLGIGVQHGSRIGHQDRVRRAFHHLAEARLALQEFPLGALAITDVADDGLLQQLAVHGDRPGTHFHRKLRAVASPVHGFEDIRLEFPSRFPLGCEIPFGPRGAQIPHVHSLNFGGSIPIHLDNTVVGVQDEAIAIHQEDDIVRQAAQVVVLLGQASMGGFHLILRTVLLELLTTPQPNGLGLNPDRIWATVYLDDDEAYELWRSVGLPQSPQG